MSKKDEALKLALEALEKLNAEKSYWWQEVEIDTVEAIEKAESICKEALAEQPAQQQEPVIDKSAAIRIATALGWEPRREWVGLTDGEMRDLEKQFNAERVRTSDEEYLIIYPGDYWAWQRAIEAKLREKNT